jgi:tetratricopeptide (TPR) repeat protein
MSFRHNITAILPYAVFGTFASCVMFESTPLPLPTSTADTSINFSQLESQVVDSPEQALNTLDDLFLLMGDTDLHLNLLFGRASLNLLEQRQLSGKLGPGLAADLFSDAERCFSWVIENGESSYYAAALRGLTRTKARQGDFVDAWDAALHWYQVAHDEFVLSDHLLIGEIGLGRIIAQRQHGAAEMPAPYLAIESLEAVVQIDGKNYVGRINLADFHTWQQRPEMAAKVLKAAIVAAPDQGTAYQRLKTLCIANRNLHTATLEDAINNIDHPKSTLWYYGEALYLQARDARTASDFVKAMAALNNSESAFEQSASLDEGFVYSCRAWISIVKTQRIWVLREDQLIDAAITATLEVIDYNPAALKDPLQDQSLGHAIDYLIADIYRSGDMRKAITLLRDVCRADDTVALFVNNLGLFTRDLARMISDNGQDAEALQLYQESWDVYSRLVDLRPEHPRSINDRALIAIYYLDEHHEFAVQELHRVISIGEALLAEMDKNVPEAEQRAVDEAVGDAYENLAYYQVFRLNQVGDAEKLLNISNTHYPFKERDGVRMIRNKLEQIR